MDLVEFLEASLRERDWTQSRLADEAKVSRQAVSAWLARELIPNSRSCEKIAAALDQDADYILELAGHRKPRTEQRPDDQVERELAARMRRLERTLAKYPRVFWLAVIEASERMADVGDAFQGVDKATEQTPDNHARQPSAGGDQPLNQDITLDSVLAAA